MRRVRGRAAGAVAAVLSGLALVLAVSPTAAHAATGPDVIAHRGSSGMAPENTA
ncbi:hydrolase, partial [Streptomyces sp. NRRL F-4711]